MGAVRPWSRSQCEETLLDVHLLSLGCDLEGGGGNLPLHVVFQQIWSCECVCACVCLSVKYSEFLEVRWDMNFFLAYHSLEEFPYLGCNFWIPRNLTQLGKIWYFCFQEPQGMDLSCSRRKVLPPSCNTFQTDS